MPAPIALDHLATLSADLRTALVLGADGHVLAGDPDLAGPAEALLTASSPGVAHRAPYGDGTLYAARSEGHVLALAVGPHALEALVVHDLLATLDDLRDC